MSLVEVSDGFLAARVVKGDGAAFAELARRYRPLIGRATIDPPPGVDVEDLRQEALLGLLATCLRFDRAKGPFPAFARCTVRLWVSDARRAAWARKRLVLSFATHDGDEPTHQLAERSPAPEGWEPSRVVELRDTLRERIELARRPRPDGRRRYSDEQERQALALLAERKTIKEAAFAVGASAERVREWANRAGQTHGGRRRFTREEITQAVELVEAGATLRQAGAAVGASSTAVLRWVRKAA